MVDYEDYPKVLGKMFTACHKEPERYNNNCQNYIICSFLCIFVIHSDGLGQLNFVQNMEYKFVELLSLEFKESPEHIIRQHVSFRYNSVKV